MHEREGPTDLTSRPCDLAEEELCKDVDRSTFQGHDPSTEGSASATDLSDRSQSKIEEEGRMRRSCHPSARKQLEPLLVKSISAQVNGHAHEKANSFFGPPPIADDRPCTEEVPSPPSDCTTIIEHNPATQNLPQIGVTNRSPRTTPVRQVCADNAPQHEAGLKVAGQGLEGIASDHLRPRLPGIMQQEQDPCSCSLKPPEQEAKSPRSSDHLPTASRDRSDDQLRMSPESSMFWYKTEMKRMQEDLKEEVERNLRQSKVALQEYEDQVRKLECQKQLLLKQVLQLEVQLSEVSTKAESSSRQLQEANALISVLQTESKGLQLDLSKAQKDLSYARMAPACKKLEEVSPPASPIAAFPGSVPKLKLQGDVPTSLLDADSGWGAPPSAEALLPRIIELWERLHISLVHRSRFFIAFQGRETFYYEAEHRRLAYLQSQLISTEEDFPEDPQALRALAKAQRRLEWERKWLAQQLKWDFTSEEREDLFLQWNIHRDSKGRKLQLLRRIWSPSVVREANGAQRSSELVLRLNGSSEATEGMFEMIFNRSEGNDASTGWSRTAATMIAPVGQVLRAVVSPLRASVEKENHKTGKVHRRKSFLSSISEFTGQVTPRKAHQCAPPSPPAWTPTRASTAWSVLHDTP